MRDLEGRIVLVTGASRGIGYQAALEAGRRGAHVIAVARTVGGLEDLDDDIKAAGGETTLVPLDVRDGDGIDRMGAAIYQRWGRLDGLVSNAGVLGVITPLSHLDVKDFDQVFAVNVTATYRLIRSLDLLLRQSDAGRAVFVSSSSSHSARPFWAAYAASNSAVETLVKSYADELSLTKIKANIFWPGAVRTQMRAKSHPGEDPDTLVKPAAVAPKLIDMITPGYEPTRSVFDYEKNEIRPL
jgi:NAD(P)-dependent dehydrogenase (short-subunit alcohol dehydrogenase family)